MAHLSAEQLEELQGFLKDWLRHSGRTQADLRRALRTASSRMPVLLGELQLLHAHQGLIGLVEKLCGIEQQWRAEAHTPLWAAVDHDDDDLDDDPDDRGSEDLEDPFGQLDLLLEQIRHGG
ncbi:MAG: hypothetical protein VKJ44_04030 [Synechococcus sp.]|nr:hypothetical protein [Synechococcus sp.]